MLWKCWSSDNVWKCRLSYELPSSHIVFITKTRESRLATGGIVWNAQWRWPSTRKSCNYRNLRRNGSQTIGLDSAIAQLSICTFHLAARPRSGKLFVQLRNNLPYCTASTVQVVHIFLPCKRHWKQNLFFLFDLIQPKWKDLGSIHPSGAGDGVFLACFLR